MIFNTIFNNGLDDFLCIMRDLPGYSPAKLKQEEFKIARYEIDYILFKFEEYIKDLPAPGVSLSSRDRILIYNARNILEGISIVFNVQINYIQRLYSNYLNYRERQLVPDPRNRADIMKPKKKTGKTRKLLHISDVIETHDIEVPVHREAIPDSSFFDVAAPALTSSVVDGAALFERDSLLVSSLGDAAHLPEDLQLRYGESLKDITTRLPSVSVPDIGQPDMSLPVAEQPYQVLDKFSLGLVEQPVDMDLSKAPRTADKPSFEQLEYELEKIIENIGISSDETKTKNKKVKYKFRVKPIMTSEEYEKFLNRRKGFMDPVKYYEKSHKKSSGKEQEEKSVEDEFEDPILRDLLKLGVKEIPVPVTPFYLRDLPLAESEPGKIPLFEFPIIEKDVQHHDEVLPGRRTDGDVLRVDLEGPTDFHSDVRPTPESDEIQNLSLLMTALSLDYAPRISMPQHFEEAPLPSILEDVRQTSLPQRHDKNGRKRTHLDIVAMSLDELLSKITDLCTRTDTTVIKFIDICDISKTKLEAARVFVQLIELWRQKLISLNQSSPHPGDIFVTLSH